MARTRYREGDVTIELDDGLARFVRGLVSAAEVEVIRVLEQAAEGVAQKARAEWYGPNGVKRRTGQSGNVQVITTFDRSRGEVRVSIGSVDTRKVDGKPLAALVHRASPFNGGDGKYLVPELIRKPAAVAIRRVTPELGRAIVARASRG